MSDERFLRAANLVASFSPDPNTKVGCVIANQFGDIVSSACNELPWGVRVSADRLDRPAKYEWIEHAERNAIYDAARKGEPLLGCTMYLPWFPCVECARGIVQSGIAELVCYAPDLADARWGESHKKARVVLDEGRVVVRYVEKVATKEKSR